MQVTEMYNLRDSMTDTVKKDQISSAIKTIENAFETFLTGAHSSIKGQKTEYTGIDDVKSAMELFKSLGMEIEEINDETAKLFVLKYGKEMLY